MARPKVTTQEAYADANLLIAFLAGPTHPFHAPAVAIMGRMDRGELRLIVSPIVVAEVVWAARTALGLARAKAAALLLDVLDADGFEILERPVVRRALELQATHPRLDVADAYLAARAVMMGPTTIASFDSDLDSIAGVARIQA